MFDAFISYSSINTNIAYEICDYLEKEGLQCWIAPRNVRAGKPYSAEIIEGLSNSQVLVLVYSSASSKSKHVVSELDFAFNSEKIIIPFCIEEEVKSEIFSYYLAATHMLLGCPTPSERYKDLKENIINNIPSLASERNHQKMLEQVARELGVSVKDLLNLSKSDGKSRYDILQNDRGEILLILRERKGPAVNPILFVDSFSKYALLYRSHMSSVFFDDIAQNANDAIRQVRSITIIETSDNEDIIREYTAGVRVINDVKTLMDD